MIVAGYILLGLTLLLAFIGGVIASCFAAKEGFIRWRTVWFGAAAGLVLVAYLLVGFDEIGRAEWAQIFLLIGLVLVTFLYALVTFRMAKEMREQRLSEARPYLLLKLTRGSEQWKNAPNEKRPDEFYVTVFNAGNGPAMNLRAALWSPTDTHKASTRAYLSAGELSGEAISRLSTEETILGAAQDVWLPELRERIKTGQLAVAVEYEDIHHARWASYLCLDYLDDTGWVKDGELNVLELKSVDS